MTVDIEEILGRSEQGVTEPYKCRGTDGHLYFVKGKGAGYPSLVKEWIAGRLGQLLGLPIPAFNIMRVPRELYDLDRESRLRDLGYGLSFGSRQVPNVNELSFLNASTVAQELKRDIAAFDWWVRNGDRTLAEAGGNPNILWSETECRPFVIDHNLAFDQTVTLHSQSESHIFADSLREICDTPELQAHYNGRFHEALLELPAIVNEVPERWHFLDDALSIETGFTADEIELTLKRYQTSSFWNQE